MAKKIDLKTLSTKKLFESIERIIEDAISEVDEAKARCEYAEDELNRISDYLDALRDRVLPDDEPVSEEAVEP